MDFRNPGFLDDERAEMLLGVDAGDASADQRPDHQFQPPAPQNHNRVGINENQLVRRQCLFTVMFRVVLQNKVRELPDGKTPYPVRVNEFDEFRAAAGSIRPNRRTACVTSDAISFYGS